MDKLKVAALVASSFVAGAVGGRASATEPEHSVALQNVELIRSPQADGGVSWVGRACAVEKLGTLSAEPCWSIQLTDSEAAVTVARALAQKR